MKRGFTLVEIMIVVAIVALLAAIAIPNLLRARVNANESNAQATLRTISTSLESYAAADPNGAYPTDFTGEVFGASPKYINKDYLVDCATGSPCQGYEYACTLASTGYTCTANASSCGTTGTRDFTISTGGLLSAANCT